MHLPPQKSGSEASMARRMDVDAPGKVMTHEKAGGNDQEVLFAKSNGRLAAKGKRMRTEELGARVTCHFQPRKETQLREGMGKVPIFVPPNVLCLGP